MMKRYMSLFLLVFFMIPFCSCSIGGDNTESEDTVTEQESVESGCLMTLPGYTVPDRDAVITTTLEYDIKPISEDHSFEEIVDVFLEKVGIDDYTLGETYQGESEYPPVYFPDYSLVVEGSRLDVYYVPYDYELHTTRTFGLQYFHMMVIEYDDPEWAKIGFWGDYQQYAATHEYLDYINDDITNGCCFINDGNISAFRASYYLNDCVMIYQYYESSGTPEQYQIYLDICEELGLPTCDEVTEEILG